MRKLSSLRSRVFLACAFVAALAIALGTLFVSLRVSRDAEAELRARLETASEQIVEQYQARLERLELLASLIADLPKLKAAVSTNDPPTVVPIAADYRERVGSDLVTITNDRGEVLAALGEGAKDVPGTAVAEAIEGRTTAVFHEADHGALEIVVQPIVIGAEPPEVLGTLSFGFVVGDALARSLGALVDSEVALVSRSGRVLASSLGENGESAGTLATVREPAELRIGDSDYVALSAPLSGASGGPRAVVLRSKREQATFLEAFREGVLLAGAIGALLAILLSYAVARTITRPLAAIIAAMREVSATGNLNRKIALAQLGSDEDARLLASTFNRLTESIAESQRRAALEERLSALGRLSTVIAHEIRNPLMIIKTSVSALLREPRGGGDIREIADDIDHEVRRLNWMVGEVLDFARPLRISRRETDVGELCRVRVEAVAAEDAGLSISIDVEPSLPTIQTDPELLERALVNVLSNAKDAVLERRAPPSASGHADIDVRVARDGDAVRVEVRDRGIGIGAEDLGRIFEPYFTGKRTGTGLGLAITKNIVESLGGTIGVESSPGAGTTMRVELPVEAPGRGESREAVVEESA